MVLINGILSGAEIAIVTLRQSRLRELVARGSGAARSVQLLRGKPERFLATVQIGITVVGAAAGAFGGATFARDLEPLVARWPPVAPYARELSLGAVVALISYLSLVLGELVPKSLALKAPERYSLAIGRPLHWLSLAVRPLVWLLTASSNLVLRLFDDETSFTEARLSPEELRHLVEEAARTGSVHPGAGEIAARALGFAELTVAEVMVPRSEVVALSLGTSREALRRVLLEQTFSRFPVYEGTTDHVVGYVSVKDVLALAWDERLFVLEDLLRPAYFVREGTRAVDVLGEMRRRRVPFAVVVDERGGLVGLVTLEDLLEELVGEIFSEHVKDVGPGYRREPDGAVVVSGTAPVRELNRALAWSLPESDQWTTLAGLCVALAGRVPSVGERLRAPGGASLEIVEASDRRVRSVRVREGAGPG